MELPYSAQPILARFDFGYSITLAASGGTPYVASVTEQVSGSAAIQLTQVAQPQFSLSTSRVVPFYDSCVFATNDYLAFDALASIAATSNSFSIYAAIKATSPASANQDIFTFGKGTSGDGYTRVGVSGSAAFFSDKNDTPAVVAGSGGTIDTNPHIIGLISANGTLTLRVDGAQVAQQAVSGTHTYTTCSIGALRNNSTTANYFNGNIFEIAVFKGQCDITAVETYFIAEYTKGINRTY